MIVKTHPDQRSLTPQGFRETHHKPLPSPSRSPRVGRRASDGVPGRGEDPPLPIKHLHLDMGAGVLVSGQDTGQQAGNVKPSVVGGRVGFNGPSGVRQGRRDGWQENRQSHQPGKETAFPAVRLEKRRTKRGSFHKSEGDQKGQGNAGRDLP